MRQSDYRQFIFNLNQARDFLLIEKKLTTIYNTISFNGKLVRDEIESFFERCNLSATSYEIKEALEIVLKRKFIHLFDNLWIECFR
jgi:N-glycosylase/DNA lyase